MGRCEAAKIHLSEQKPLFCERMWKLFKFSRTFSLHEYLETDQSFLRAIRSSHNYLCTLLYFLCYFIFPTTFNLWFLSHRYFYQCLFTWKHSKNLLVLILCGLLLSLYVVYDAEHAKSSFFVCHNLLDIFDVEFWRVILGTFIKSIGGVLSCR